MQKISYRYEFRIQTKHTWKIIQTVGYLESISNGDSLTKVHQNRKNRYSWKHGTCQLGSCTSKTFKWKSKA